MLLECLYVFTLGFSSCCWQCKSRPGNNTSTTIEPNTQVSSTITQVQQGIIERSQEKNWYMVQTFSAVTQFIDFHEDVAGLVPNQVYCLCFTGIRILVLATYLLLKVPSSSCTHLTLESLKTWQLVWMMREGNILSLRKSVLTLRWLVILIVSS